MVAAVSIVVVAAAVVVPVLAQSADQERALQTACLSNEKQLGLGLLQYVQDYDERYPPAVSGAPQGWAGRIQPYVRSTAIFHCPKDPTTANNSISPPALPVSYAMNSNLVTHHPRHPGDEIGMSIAEMESPASTVLLYEIQGDQAQITLPDEGTHWYHALPQSGYVSPAGTGAHAGPEWGRTNKGSAAIVNATGPVPGRPKNNSAAPHNGGSNYGFADGHCRWLLGSQVSTGTANPIDSGVQDQPPGAAAGPMLNNGRVTFTP